jgi:3-methyladenine DNA glycosylase AlkD
VRAALRAEADPRKAVILKRFFKTGKGEYGEGDSFIGVVVPKLRTLARRHGDLPLSAIHQLVKSPVHEERLLGLIILVLQFAATDAGGQTQRFRFYVKHLRYINNWDLIDGSAEHIIGGYLLRKGKRLLHTLARSPRVWDRRVAILSTFYFIKRNRFAETLKIARMLLHDDHDLIHKATGWMLREVGNRNSDLAAGFLRSH